MQSNIKPSFSENNQPDDQTIVFHDIETYGIEERVDERIAERIRPKPGSVPGVPTLAPEKVPMA